MDTVSLLSEISILKRYIGWLETSLASYEPDWICDKMGDKDLCHDWCYDNCGTEAWTHDCFKKYYDNFVADRKTEPQKCGDCRNYQETSVTYIDGSKTFDCPYADTWRDEDDKACERFEPIEDEPQTDCAWK